MANWKLALIWLATIAWRLGSSMILVAQGKENDLTHSVNWLFWMGYVFLWVFLQYPNWNKKGQEDQGIGDALYCMAWVLLVAITGLALRFLLWVLLRLAFGIEVRLFWGEVFAVIFATICLYIPVWLRKHTVNSQELI